MSALERRIFDFRLFILAQLHFYIAQLKETWKKLYTISILHLFVNFSLFLCLSLFFFETVSNPNITVSKRVSKRKWPYFVTCLFFLYFQIKYRPIFCHFYPQKATKRLVGSWQTKGIYWEWRKEAKVAKSFYCFWFYMLFILWSNLSLPWLLMWGEGIL